MEAATREALSERLELLTDCGAARYDGPAITLITGLLSRAAQLEPGAGARVASRAEARLERLESEYDTARGAARAAIERLEAVQGRPAPKLAEALAEGRLDEIARAERRLRPGEDPLSPERTRSAAAYRDAVADFTTTLSRANAPREDSEEAGLLNGRKLAERILAAAEVISPAYHRSLIGGLVDLAALMHLPALAQPRKRSGQ
jgi:hypothetical protein